MDYEGLRELVEKRRSIRRFKPDPIPAEYIDKIIDVARWAPSGFNSQPWEFIVVRKPELKDNIVNMVREVSAQTARMEATRQQTKGSKEWQPQSDGLTDYSVAPVFILLFGDTRTRKGLPIISTFSQHRWNINFYSNLANAFLYMNLAATTLGLASQWVSSVRDPVVHCLLKNLLGIPTEMEVYDLMALGYPAAQSGGKLMRNMDKMVHYDYCGPDDFRTDEEVDDYIRRTWNWVAGAYEKPAD